MNKPSPIELDSSVRSASFPTEAELVNTFLLQTQGNEKSNVLVHPELDSGAGIADLVFFRKRKDWERYPQLVKINPRLTYAFVCLPYRRSFSLDEFSLLACVSRKASLKCLGLLINYGFVSESKKGWIKRIQPRPPFSKIWSIEAKIRNWQKALYQATQYLEFSNQSWVLLDHRYAGPAIRNLNEFRKRNIGLLSMTVHGELSIALEPKDSPPRSSFRYWYAMAECLRKNATSSIQ